MGLEEILVIAMFASFMGLLLLGFPVAWSLAGIGLLFAVLGYVLVEHFDANLWFTWDGTIGVLDARIYGIVANELMVALPLFIFMGIMLDRSGIAERLMHSLVRVLGPLRGGYAVTVVVVGILLAASTGIVGASVALLGIDPPRYQRIIPLADDLIAGQFTVGAGHAVIGKELARDLGLGIGDKLRLDAGEGREAVVDIAGIFELGVRELDARYVYLDLKQAQTLLDLPGGVTVIDTTVAEIFEADQVAERLARLTGLRAESWMETNGQLLNALSSQSMTTEMIRVFVGISVAFGIASVLAVSVVQRTREIGILRAMGSPRGQILRVFLLQGGLLGL